jgi:Major Facilitator Superfamily
MLGGFLLLGGRMADLFGRRRMLLTGLTVFSSASLLAGVAGSAGLLIGARPLQGFGAALLPPAALSILAVNFAEALGAVTAAIASPGAPRRRPSSSRLRPPRFARHGTDRGVGLGCGVGSDPAQDTSMRMFGAETFGDVG